MITSNMCKVSCKFLSQWQVSVAPGIFYLGNWMGGREIRIGAKKKNQADHRTSCVSWTVADQLADRLIKRLIESRVRDKKEGKKAKKDNKARNSFTLMEIVEFFSVEFLLDRQVQV